MFIFFLIDVYWDLRTKSEIKLGFRHKSLGARDFYVEIRVGNYKRAINNMLISRRAIHGDKHRAHGS